MSRLGVRVLACLLLAAVLCAGGVVRFHTHWGPDFRPSCPGCQQERTIGSSSAAASIASVVIAPTVIGVVTDLLPPGAPRNAAVLQSSPRSPPFPF